MTSDNSHYSIVKDLLLRFPTERRNFNSQRSAKMKRFQKSAAWLLKFQPVFKSAICTWKLQCVGGGEGIRTPDPMVANHVLCQLSYTPDKQLWDLKSQSVMSDSKETHKASFTVQASMKFLNETESGLRSEIWDLRS